MMSLQLGETFLALRYRDQSNGSSGPKTLCFSNTMSYLKSLYPLVCKGFDNVNLLSRQHLFTLQGWGEGEGHTKANAYDFYH